MKRREFITLLGGAAAWPLSLGAQPTKKSYRVGYLALLAGQDSTIVKQRLNELDYVEGQNLIFDFRSAEGRPERLPELATEFVRTNPDLIIAGFGTLTARAAQAATTTIPIVFVSVGDPIGAAIVRSLSRPGANITGLTGQGSEVSVKRLEILEELVPGARTVAILMNPETPFSALTLQELRIAAEARAYRLEVIEIRSADKLATSIEAAAKAEARGLLPVEDPLLLSLRRQMADLATAARLPIIAGNREFTEAGGLMSYGTERRHLYRRAAEFVDKILKGTRPADIPVELPTKFELVINLKTAKALGLEVPPTLLARADEVIE